MLRSWSQHPRADRVESIVTMSLLVAGIAVAVALGQGWAVLLYWLLPLRLAVLVLAFSFDYLPHRPHQIPASQDRYRATRVLSENPLLELTMLGQTFHLIHHLYPGVPFYRYRAIWTAQPELLPRAALASPPRPR